MTGPSHEGVRDGEGSLIAYHPGGARAMTTEREQTYPATPPRLRKAPDTHPESLLAGRCDTCASFSSIGFCVRYQAPVEEDDLCDGYVSIMDGGKRQWAER